MPVIVTIKLISVQFQLKLPAKTELGNNVLLRQHGSSRSISAALCDNNKKQKEHNESKLW